MSEADCRACGERLQPILDLGSMPLVDELAADRRSALGCERFGLLLCHCPDCGWVQLAETPAPERLFGPRYPYHSSVSEAVSASARAHAEALVRDRDLDRHSRVVEIASNDGYQLLPFAERGIPVLGVEPAPGPAGVARARGIETDPAFFDPVTAGRLRDEKGPADVLLAKNVLAHVPDPNGFVAGVAHLLAEDGLASFEFPYLAHLIDQVQFDTIYHEHVSYLSVTPLDRLFRRHGLHIVAIREIDLHGGSLRLDVAHRPDPGNPGRDRYLRQEAARDLTGEGSLSGFAARVGERIAAIREAVETVRNEGRSLAAYGAAAKGVVLLTACGLDHRQIDFVVDRNPHKHGRYMPGAGLAIHPVEELVRQSPDVTLMLAWNFADEIRRQQRGYERGGGRWLVPVPAPRWLPAR